MHPRYLIYLNVLMLLNGLLALHFQWEIQFDIQKDYDEGMILRLFGISFLSISGLVLGALLGAVMPKIKFIRVRFPRLSKASTNFVIASILLLAAIFSFLLFLNSISLSRTGAGLERVMGGKYLTPLLIFLSAITVKWLDGKRSSVLPLYLLTFIMVLYAYGDGTRAAMIGSFAVFMYSLVVRDYKVQRHAFLSVVIVFVALILGRSFVSGVVLDIGIADFFDLLYKSVFVFWHYFITFSGLHAAYATADGVGFFGVSEFIYSVSPIPAFLISPPSSTDLWRVDQFRPLGAQAEMWKVSPVFNFLFSVFIGFFLRRTVRKERSLMLILVGAILYLSFLMSYQYGLRTIQWLIWLAIVIFLINGFLSDRRITPHGG